MKIQTCSSVGIEKNLGLEPISITNHVTSNKGLFVENLIWKKNYETKSLELTRVGPGDAESGAE